MKHFKFLSVIVVLALVLAGCTDDNGSKKDEPYTGEPGSISIIGIPSAGAVLGVNTSQLNGKGAVQYRWVIGDDIDNPLFDSTIRPTKDHLGKTVSVRVRRSDWAESVTSLTETSDVIVRGWMVKTIATENHLDAPFAGIRSVGVDSNGMVYTSDSRFIYKIDPETGDISSFFDSGSGFSGSPKYLAVGPDNSIYMPEMWWWWNVRRYFANGTAAPPPGVEIFKDMFYYGVSAFDAKNYPNGSGNGTAGGDSKPFENAMEGGFAVDEDGNIYVGAIYHERSIIKVVPRVYDGTNFVSHQTVSLLAGGVRLADALRPFSDGTQTDFYTGPIGISSDAIDLNGTPGTVAIASSARFHDFGGMAAGGGYLYVTDTHNDSRIRKINTTTGLTTTLTGGDWDYRDGPLASAAFTNTKAIAYGSDGNLYVVDRTGAEADRGPVIRKIDLEIGMVSTIAGNANSAGLIDGFALDGARFQANIEGIAFYDHPELGSIIFIADKAAGDRDSANAAIRMLFWDNSTEPVDTEEND